MGRVIIKWRKGKGSVFISHSTGRIAPNKWGKLDQIEREDYIKGIVKNLLHEPASGALLAKLVLGESHIYELQKEYFLASEGMHSGQHIFCGKKAQINVGNIFLLKEIPEGSLVYNVEQYQGIKDAFEKASGSYGLIVY